VQKLATKYHCNFIDVYTSLNGHIDEHIISDDRVHPNASGVLLLSYYFLKGQGIFDDSIDHFKSIIDGIPPKLKKLCISGNPINYLDVQYNTELEHLECGYTGISEIENIANCKKLKHLDVRALYLDTLSGIEECTELKTIRIIDINKPDKSFIDLEIPKIIKDYKTNNCDINLELNRFLDVINRLQKNYKKVYNDKQNVHNSNIAKSIKKSLSHILEETLNEDINLIHQTL
jgi:hypothetical protein